MDRRYFHGIRTSAARVLSRQAKPEVDWIGLYHLEKAFQELFCLPGTSMTRPNDFSDRTAYNVQCAIPKAIGSIRNNDRCPFDARRFLRDKLVDNDNSNNEVGITPWRCGTPLTMTVLRLPLYCYTAALSSRGHGF